MKFDTKIAVIIRKDLPVWQKLNVTAFTVSGIVAANEGLVGKTTKTHQATAIYRWYVNPC